MKTANIAIRPRARPICQLCDYITHRPNHQRRFLATSQFLETSTRGQLRIASNLQPRILSRSAASAPPNPADYEPVSHHLIDDATPARTEEGAQKTLSQAEELVDNILESRSIPSEDSVTAALAAIKETVLIRLDLIKQSKTKSRTADSSSAGAILHLDSKNGSQRETFDYLSFLAQKLVEDPRVFISPSVLKTYVTIQSLLHRPSSFPEIFTLYKSKPGAKPPTSTSSSKKKKISFHEAPNPNAAKQAIPAPVASMALDAAIKRKDLPLALDIIDTTFAHPSFHRAKLIQRALLPFTGVIALPFAVYALSTKLSLYQNTMDPSTATMVSFAGILTYATCTATIGIVALTTANDQMDRVTWATGMPLRERWLREEERAAVDKVAGAWGFKEVWKRGEEEGVEWEGLREWVGIRGMVLDRTELMEGMQ